MNSSALPPTDPSSAFKQRVITAAILSGVFVAIEIFAAYTCFGRYLLLFLGLLVGTICALEFAEFSTNGSNLGALAKVRRKWLRFALCSLPAVLVVLNAVSVGVCGDLSAQTTNSLFFGISITLVLATLCTFSLARTQLELAKQEFSETIPAIILVGLGAAGLVALAALPGKTGVLALAWLVIVCSCNDSAAYMVGRKVAGPKLAAAISPNKTVSGSAAGIIVGAMIGTLCFGLLSLETNSALALAFSLLICVAGQLGDLLKSYLKRLSGVKDSGSILPGHGGVLDRVDALLFSAPVLYAWIIFS